MSTTQGAFGDSSGQNGPGPGAYSYGGRGCGPGRRGYGRWSGFEILAMVLGFIVFWPVGLAILGYKIWQRRNGGPDLQTFATQSWSQARSAMSGAGAAGRPWSRDFDGSGNAAFDAWREGELARLEEERRKLEVAHREFAEFVENVRRAKDREEFERFMNERGNRAAG